MLACPAATLLSQLKKTFLHRVRGKYPGQLEIGTPLPRRAVLSLGPSGWSRASLGLSLVPECLHGVRRRWFPSVPTATSSDWEEGSVTSM